VWAQTRLEQQIFVSFIVLVQNKTRE
jgi:hypothetical protein